jgi:hypothetical protein
MVYAKQTLLFHYNIFDSSSNVEKAAHFKKREKSKTWKKGSKRKLETYLKIK